MIRGGNIGCSRKRSVEARRIIFAGFVRIDDTNEMVISWITFVDQKAIIRKKRGIYRFQGYIDSRNALSKVLRYTCHAA